MKKLNQIKVEHQHKKYIKYDVNIRYGNLFMDFSGMYIFMTCSPYKFLINKTPLESLLGAYDYFQVHKHEIRQNNEIHIITIMILETKEKTTERHTMKKR